MMWSVHLLMAVLGVWLAHIVYYKEYRHWFRKKPEHKEQMVLRPETWGRTILTDPLSPKITFREESEDDERD